MGLVDWASQGFILMEFHVHLNMLFWLQSGKVDCWEFNQGFENSDLEGPMQRKNGQRAARLLEVFHGPSKINVPC